MRGYARVDIRLDQRGLPWVLEVNAITYNNGSNIAEWVFGTYFLFMREVEALYEAWGLERRQAS